MLVKRLGRSAAVRDFRKRHPLPKLQYSIKEIYAAVLYFACAMALCTLLVNATMGGTEEYMLGVLAVYLAIVTGLGFYIALDVLRTKEATQSGWARAGVILFTALFGTFLFLIPLLIAWRAWQRALLFNGMEDERRAKARQKLRQRKERLAKLKAEKSEGSGAVDPAAAPSSPPPA